LRCSSTGPRKQIFRRLFKYTSLAPDNNRFDHHVISLAVKSALSHFNNTKIKSSPCHYIELYIHTSTPS
jgi:hypothetical protein